MSRFRYQSGEHMEAGDKILFHGEPGSIEFVVDGATGDASKDWVLDQSPEGGVMLTASGFGSVLLNGSTERSRDLHVFCENRDTCPELGLVGLPS